VNAIDLGLIGDIEAAVAAEDDPLLHGWF